MNRVRSLLEYKGEPRADLGVAPFLSGKFFFCNRASDGTSGFVT